MNTFTANWAFSESYMSEIKKILRNNAVHIVRIDVADADDDLKHSTDLKVKITSGNVAVRIRRAHQHYRDFTVRAKNGNAKTEITKLREGYADWYLYLWTNERGICDWILIDLAKMRDTGLLNDDRPVKINKDGYTGFCVYGIDEIIRVGALIARFEK